MLDHGASLLDGVRSLAWLVTTVHDSSGWATTLFAVLVPVGVILLGGLVHLVYRVGLLVQKVEQLTRDVHDIRRTQTGNNNRRYGNSENVHR